MIIDIHTHTFPETIADKAVASLAKAAQIENKLDGRNTSLQKSMKEADVDFSVLMPVATKPRQCEMINENAIAINQTGKETGLLSFGAMHPKYENYKDNIMHLADSGIKGIKLHPVYQDSAVDGIETLRIIDEAYSRNLMVLIHSGYDIGFPGNELASVKKLCSMISQVPPKNLILAHMGGWKMWNQVLEKICGNENIYLDAAFSINNSTTNDLLTLEQFVEIVNVHGSENILFGSDSPWTSQKESIEIIKNSGLDKKSIDNILGENAAKLLF